MRSFQTVKLFYEFKMSAWLELSMNNTLISVSDPLNIWPQNNKQILYYLTQFYQTPDFLGKKKNTKKTPNLSRYPQWLKHRSSSPNYPELQNISSLKKNVYLKMESYFVYTHQPESLKEHCCLKRKCDTLEVTKAM